MLSVSTFNAEQHSSNFCDDVGGDADVKVRSKVAVIIAVQKKTRIR